MMDPSDMDETLKRHSDEITKFRRKTKQKERELESSRVYEEAVFNTLPAIQDLTDFVACKSHQLANTLASATGQTAIARIKSTSDKEVHTLREENKHHEAWQASFQTEIPVLLQTAASVASACQQIRTSIQKLQSLTPQMSVLQERVTNMLNGFEKYMQVVLKQKETIATTGVTFNHHQPLVIVPTLPDVTIDVGLGKKAVMSMPFVTSWMFDQGFTADRTSMTFVAAMQTGCDETGWKAASPHMFNSSSTHMFSYQGTKSNVFCWKSSARPFPEVHLLPGICSAKFPLAKVYFRFVVQIVMDGGGWATEMNRLGLHNRPQPVFFSPSFSVVVTKKDRKLSTSKWSTVQDLSHKRPREE